MGAPARVDHGAPGVRAAGTATLQDLVHLTLADPDAHGCVVCGGMLRRREGGVACRDCGSELTWGPSPQPVWVG